MIRSVLIALVAAVAAALAITAVRWPALVIVALVLAVAAPFSALARFAAGAFAAALVICAGIMVWDDPWLLAAAAVLTALGPVLAVARFVLAPAAARRHYPMAVWAGLRWRWLARNCGLAPVDLKARHAPAGESAPLGPLSRAVLWADGPKGAAEPVIGRVHYPRARFRADEFGLIAQVRTVPGTGRKEAEKAAPYLADYWRCARVQVSQPAPGRLVLRGVRRDPLTVPLGPADCPPGTWDTPPGPGGPHRLYLGRDEWGAHRHASLSGLTGITVGGLPGAGKTTLIGSWLAQLAAWPAVFTIIDGKGGGDYDPWRGLAELYCADDLGDAMAALEDQHARMRARFAQVQAATGSANAWHAGPSPAFPLVVTVIDECHTFFDLEGVKSDRGAEAKVRACRAIAGQLVRKGRSVLMVTILITQKQTSDAIPTAIRDNCGLGLCFAVKTREAAVSALGDAIRDHPGYCPTLLQDPAHVGVATVALRTGHDPFVRIRCPEPGPPPLPVVRPIPAPAGGLA